MVSPIYDDIFKARLNLASTPLARLPRLRIDGGLVERERRCGIFYGSIRRGHVRWWNVD